MMSVGGALSLPVRSDSAVSVGPQEAKFIFAGAPDHGLEARTADTSGAYHEREMKVWLRRAATFEKEAEADAEFWATMTPDERVAILEEMRQAWIEEHGGDEGLRRTVRRLSA